MRCVHIFFADFDIGQFCCCSYISVVSFLFIPVRRSVRCVLIRILNGALVPWASLDTEVEFVSSYAMDNRVFSDSFLFFNPANELVKMYVFYVQNRRYWTCPS